MKRYERSGAQWANDANDWMASILIPKQRDLGTFKLFLQGLDKYIFEFNPSTVTNAAVPQLEDHYFRISVLPGKGLYFTKKYVFNQINIYVLP